MLKCKIPLNNQPLTTILLAERTTLLSESAIIHQIAYSQIKSSGYSRASVRQTASRLRSRIESVLDWATVNGWRKGDNPARLKGHMEYLLPKVRVPCLATNTVKWPNRRRVRLALYFAEKGTTHGSRYLFHHPAEGCVVKGR